MSHYPILSIVEYKSVGVLGVYHFYIQVLDGNVNGKSRNPSFKECESGRYQLLICDI